jgi:hypothetical protein
MKVAAEVHGLPAPAGDLTISPPKRTIGGNLTSDAFQPPSDDLEE